MGSLPERIAQKAVLRGMVVFAWTLPVLICPAFVCPAFVCLVSVLLAIVLPVLVLLLPVLPEAAWLVRPLQASQKLCSPHLVWEQSVQQFEGLHFSLPGKMLFFRVVRCCLGQCSSWWIRQAESVDLVLGATGQH